MNERLRILQRQPRRISITLSYHVHEELLKRSEEEGRSMSNLCAFLLEDALRHNNGAAPATAGIGTMLSNNHTNNDLRTRPRSPF
jgi:macrodomain Ter protein organizer (MatP/YcbG family)